MAETPTRDPARWAPWIARVGAGLAAICFVLQVGGASVGALALVPLGLFIWAGSAALAGGPSGAGWAPWAGRLGAGLAAVCFALAAFHAPVPVDLVALGLFLWAGSAAIA